MAYYTENKKLGALTQVTLPLSDSDNVLVEQSGTAKRTTILDFVKKVFTIGTTLTTTTTSDSALVIQSNGTVAKAALNSLVPTNSVTNAMLVGNITDAKLDSIATPGKVLDAATTANDGQTSNTSAVYLGTTGNDKIVKRNGSGNFSANVITAAVVGNATSATNIASGVANDILYQSAANTTAKLSSDSSTNGKYLRSNGASQAPSWESFAATSTVADNITGGATGAILYQSSANVTAKLAPGAAGTLLTSTGTANIPGWVATATTAATADTIVKRDSLGSFTGATITATTGFSGNVTGNCSGSSGSCTGNAATASSATKLTTARNFTLSGDVTGTASFDGQTDASIVCTVVDDSHNHAALTAATNANTASTIVKRGATNEIAVGPLSATTISGTTGYFGGYLTAAAGATFTGLTVRPPTGGIEGGQIDLLNPDQSLGGYLDITAANNLRLLSNGRLDFYVNGNQQKMSITSTGVDINGAFNVNGNSQTNGSGTIGKHTVQLADQKLISGVYYQSGVGQFAYINSANNAETGSTDLRLMTGGVTRLLIGGSNGVLYAEGDILCKNSMQVKTILGSNLSPNLLLYNADGAVDKKSWRIVGGTDGMLYFQKINDANTAGTNSMTLDTYGNLSPTGTYYKNGVQVVGERASGGSGFEDPYNVDYSRFGSFDANMDGNNNAANKTRSQHIAKIIKVLRWHGLCD